MTQQPLFQTPVALSELESFLWEATSARISPRCRKRLPISKRPKIVNAP